MDNTKTVVLDEVESAVPGEQNPATPGAVPAGGVSGAAPAGPEDLPVARRRRWWVWGITALVVGGLAGGAYWGYSAYNATRVRQAYEKVWPVYQEAYLEAGRAVDSARGVWETCQADASDLGLECGPGPELAHQREQVDLANAKTRTVKNETRQLEELTDSLAGFAGEWNTQADQWTESIGTARRAWAENVLSGRLGAVLEVADSGNQLVAAYPDSDETGRIGQIRQSLTDLQTSIGGDVSGMDSKWREQALETIKTGEEELPGLIQALQARHDSEQAAAAAAAAAANQPRTSNVASAGSNRATSQPSVNKETTKSSSSSARSGGNSGRKAPAPAPARPPAPAPAPAPASNTGGWVETGDVIVENKTGEGVCFDTSGNSWPC
ncbi:hypothetical protein ACU19_08265 [Actinobaculum suis]|uniref:hypothetical protein n=1 Tax=Actinobaculum suis TaxID=1657 RepID=UPI00066FEA72|nr:hypothetical protein [Actinobaculum suis]KMY22750.1 hypothetical protein ACU19_08265 [Actinobaculum suis]